MAAGLAAVLAMAGSAPVGAAPLDVPPSPESGLPANASTDVVVYGATPGGVVAAVAAARGGARVILVEPTNHIGGMMSSGLSWTDRGDVGVIGGVAREVFDRIEAIEGSGYGRYAFQPKTASAVFAAMLSEAGVEVVLNEPLAETADAVSRAGGRITQIRTVGGHTFSASVFVDAGYEGDLMARAGVSYRIGREPISEFGEPLAGVRPASVAAVLESGADPGFPVAAPGPLGSGDDRIQASNYRVCLTTNPSNQVPFPQPAGYDAARYDVVITYIEQLVELGLTPNKSWVLHVDRLVRDKYDLNENGPVTFGLPGANNAYPEGTYAERDAIEAEHRAYQQGFLYFLRHDPRVPAEIQSDIARFGLCADEFTATGSWPPVLYLREGRRLDGPRVLNQHDTMSVISKPDAIGLGSYPLDSHVVSRWIDGDGRLLTEGGLGHPKVQRWSISYRSLTPHRAEVQNLLVPVAASATHVAYASLRMEPQYMIMGQAAGSAAAIAWTRSLAVQDISIAELQGRLRADGAVLDDPGDIATSFYGEIEWAFYQGITAGCGQPGRYCPGQSLPRDQMASLIARTLDLPEAQDDHFLDDRGNPHEADINAVAEAGITTGCGPGAYCPSGIVTRQEMASFLVRAFQLPRSSTDHFVDDGSSIHHADINSLASARVTSGCTPAAYCPTAPVTRGQVLAFLHRVYGGGPLSEGPVIGSVRTARTSTPGAPPSTPDASPSPEPATTATPEPTPDATAPSPSPEPSGTPSPSPEPSSAPEPSPAPSFTPEPSPTPEPTPQPSSTPTPAPSGGGAGADPP